MNTTSNPLHGKSHLKTLFVRSPRHVWPIVNESDNFLLPLAYPSLAAYLREYVPGVEISILDCCAREMGWISLCRHLVETQPEIVAIGWKTGFYQEGFRGWVLT